MADVQAAGDAHKATPTWNGRDFYVTIGDRSWEDCERYGFLSAGGGPFWTKPLEKLFPGARVFLYKPDPVQGYVGVGIVKERARPVTEFAPARNAATPIKTRVASDRLARSVRGRYLQGRR
jgi:hypothetical protein